MIKRTLFLLAFAVVTVGCNDTAGDGESDAGPTPDASGDVAIDGSGAPDAAVDAGLDVRIVSCDGEDQFSPNHDEDSALVIEAGFFDAPGLFICADVDDWFAVTASAGQTISAEIAFANRIGDLDLYLLPAGSNGSLDAALAVAGSLEDVEALEYTAEEDGTYFIRVNSFESAEGAYDITISVRCRGNDDCPDGFRCSFADQRCVEDLEPICGADDGEPNDDVGEAVPIVPDDRGFAVFRDRFVCEEDDDYFVLKVDEPSDITAFLDFDAGADLDLYVFDPEGQRVGAAATEAGNPETLVRRFSAPGDYVFVVDQFVTALGDEVGYSLSFEINASACRTDADCGSTPGRSLCEEGACVAFDPEEPSPAGGPCDDASDCAGALQCYQGADGFSDNFCTTQCESDADCGAFDDGYCLGLQQIAICAGACSADSECPRFYSCGEDARCDLAFCRVDADCAEDQFCRRTEQQNTGLCTATEFGGYFDDDALEDNDTDGQAVAVALADFPITGGMICDADDDWYRITIEEGPAELNVEARFDTVADLDVFVFDALGREITSGTEPDANPETATASYLAAGDYLIRVNQFPGDEDLSTGYVLDVEVDDMRDGCTVDGEECLSLVPLRIACDEAAGACGFLDGDGEVELGGFCDSTDDCVEDAEFCWAFESAEEGRNVCTIRCRDEGDCRDVDGTTCVQFRRGFAVCLPE